MSSARTSAVNMSKEEFKRVGYALIDGIADFIDRIGDRVVTTGETPAEIQGILGAAQLPETGIDAASIMKRSADLLFNHSLLNGHPKFLGYITSSAAPIGALADLLSSAINPNVGANILSPMATAIEKQTIGWLAQLIGVSADYGGIMVSGGNMANFTAFLAARTHFSSNEKADNARSDTQRMRVYCSKSTHTWIEKAAKLFGMDNNSISWIAQDDSQKMRVDLLAQAIASDIEIGWRPMMVVGNAGDVSTGAVDDFKAIASICRSYNLWFHIDGAYGLPAAVIPELKAMFAGIEEADSLALDPHKWLYSPLEAGCTLVKDPQKLLDTFSTHPQYYNFNDPQTRPHNFHEYGFQNSRGFRALKVWAALQQVGRMGYIKMIGDDIALSQYFFQLASEHSELEAITQNLSIATLRYAPSEVSKIEDREKYLNKLNQALLNSLQRGGKIFLSNAIVNEMFCLRGCIVNFRTTREDIEQIIDIIVIEGRKIHEAFGFVQRA